MKELDTREWLLTNGLGSFASGTVCDARTRIYHGWLMAALDPPDRTRLLLSHIEASLEVGGESCSLSTNFWLGGAIDPRGYLLLDRFDRYPLPTWTWRQSTWQLTRQILMPYGLSGGSTPHFHNQVLVRYTYTGPEVATLHLRPLMGDRDLHHPQQKSPELQFSQLVGSQQLLLQGIHNSQPGSPWQLRWSRGRYHPDGMWYLSYHYPRETQRGLSDYEDLYSPGYLVVILLPGESITLEARVGWPDADQSHLSAASFDQAAESEQQRLHRALAPSSWSAPSPELDRWLQAADQFIAYRDCSSSPTIMTGYPWFKDGSRAALIALPGLTLTTGRLGLARQILDNLGRQCQHGLIPSTLDTEAGKPIYQGIDSSLWWIEALGLYLEASQDWEFLAQQYGVVKQIYKAFTAGTLHNIRIDASDGLVTWDEPTLALTWMDAYAQDQPVTPRLGKPVEVNALWYSALCWASRWATILEERGTAVNPVSLSNQARRYSEQAEQVCHSMQRYWYADRQYLFDTIEPDDHRDRTMRPNAVLALSLRHCAFPPEQARAILQTARSNLLTPYGLRTLAPTDPAYIGQYQGSPWRRDLAYHQGTVWPWLLGPFVRAWRRFFDQPGDEPVPLDWQPLLDHFSQQVCLGSLSELFDGNPPHAPGGAVAQAMAIGEILRCWQS